MNVPPLHQCSLPAVEVAAQTGTPRRSPKLRLRPEPLGTGLSGYDTSTVNGAQDERHAWTSLDQLSLHFRL